MSFFKPNRVLAIDIGSCDLKVGEFTVRKNGIELTQFDVRSLGVDPSKDEDPTPSIVTSIQAAVKEKNIRPAPVIVSVSGQAAFLRLVKLPPVKRDKIFQTVQFEAQQNVPFPIDEVVWDYQLMGSSQHEMDVMLVAIKADIVQNMTDCIEAAGLEVELVDVAPMALYNAVRYNYTDLTGCTLVIDIGARSTNLVFMEENRFFSRNLPIVGTGNAVTQQLMKEFALDFKAAEEMKKAQASVAFGGAYEDYADKTLSKVSKTVRSAMTRLHVEIERSINFYRTQQGGNRPDRIFLAGGSSLITRTDEFFKSKLKLEVDYLNPFRNVMVSQAISAEDIGGNAHVLSEVVGAALRHAFPCPLEINLLPPRIAAERAFRRKQPILIAAAAGVVLIVLCWWLYFSRMAAVTGERLAKVRSRVEQLEKVELRLKEVEGRLLLVSKQAEQLAGIVRLRTEWLETLNEIHACMPDGMWLVSFVPMAAVPPPGQPPPPVKQYSHIQIKGMLFADKARDKSIPDFVERLKKNPLFGEGTKIELAPLPSLDDYAREFTILVGLKKPLS
ncbi:MAG: type IV pilus assembly protein PilM [Lentisphaerae bacterium]|nr:type IV pilus assembly protein PilM [Lentisphaerota bacterium]